MLLQKIFLILLLSCSIILNSCKPEEAVPDRIALISRTSWAMSSWTSSPDYPLEYSNGSTQYFSDILLYYKAQNYTCAGNRRFSFTRGVKENDYMKGAYVSLRSPANCSTPELQEGIWDIRELEDGLYLYLASKENPASYYNIFKIHEISEDRFSFTYKVKISGSYTEYKITETFSPVKK
ncbi:hypothetical protein SAMN05518672_101866 [Chitinophaga sp. CF118]|uniref:hypothetical protein n=1 Tax=Chitinophaga sp. CF118 TaxID=1884367 RepID=UPI0008EBE502|nr:hypothetical protein [Chitinophaga sp. CF118]SFD17238.1 hypothetical protein SAMN05518672_101866 [Chitinophaga sp. CF118]